ncbi:FixH family protein [Azospirillum sp.]|uniref:FixH family protein n=1 Tax=Azospirillum sp. TaxID=34012 RepID=UPI0026363127|nr:FixH family protein [Azospirillum sp.]
MTMTSSTGLRPTRMPRQKGWYIPWIFVGLFLVVAAVNGVMIHFAFSSWTGLQTEEHFLKGIKYNQDLAGARAQAERGWQVNADFTSTEPLKGLASLTLRDKNGALLEGATVKIKLIRPTSVGHDVTMDLPYLGEGRYAAPVTLTLEGQWDMRVEIQHASGDYQNQKRVWVQ